MIYPKLLELLKRAYKIIYCLVTNQPLELFQNNNSDEIETEKNLQKDLVENLVWVECDDIYKPIEEKIVVFTEKRSLSPEFHSVYISEVAHASLLNHLASNLKIEQGGILFGNAYSDPQLGVYVEIVAAIAAPETNASGTHLVFTANSWQGIMNHATELTPGNQIVGWYHSHPDLGVFMSYTDMKTHQVFFAHPWCLSIVYDPIRQEIGYFQGFEAKKVKPTIFSSYLRN